MIIYYEAYRMTGEGDLARAEEVAAVDVTAMTEQERADTLTDMKVIYPDCQFRQHLCGHLNGVACQVTDL